MGQTFLSRKNEEESVINIFNKRFSGYIKLTPRFRKASRDLLNFCSKFNITVKEVFDFIEKDQKLTKNNRIAPPYNLICSDSYLYGTVAPYLNRKIGSKTKEEEEFEKSFRRTYIGDIIFNLYLNNLYFYNTSSDKERQYKIFSEIVFCSRPIGSQIEDLPPAIKSFEELIMKSLDEVKLPFNVFDLEKDKFTKDGVNLIKLIGKIMLRYFPNDFIFSLGKEIQSPWAERIEELLPEGECFEIYK